MLVYPCIYMLLDHIISCVYYGIVILSSVKVSVNVHFYSKYIFQCVGIHQILGVLLMQNQIIVLNDLLLCFLSWFFLLIVYNIFCYIVPINLPSLIHIF